jgi:molybdopterin-containing oxidoreductase family membrane subunit
VFHPTWVDIWTYIGTLGIFTSLFLLFIRFLPMIAMSEVKTAIPEADPHFGAPPGAESISPGGKEHA